MFECCLPGFLCCTIQVIQLPRNSISLNGSLSTDDHDSLSYEWSLSPESKDKVVEMQVSRRAAAAFNSCLMLLFDSQTAADGGGSLCSSGRANTNLAAVGHAGGGLHLPADCDRLVWAAGYGPGDCYCAAR